MPSPHFHAPVQPIWVREGPCRNIRMPPENNSWHVSRHRRERLLRRFDDDKQQRWLACTGVARGHNGVGGAGFGATGTETQCLVHRIRRHRLGASVPIRALRAPSRRPRVSGDCSGREGSAFLQPIRQQWSFSVLLSPRGPAGDVRIVGNLLRGSGRYPDGTRRRRRLGRATVFCRAIGATRARRARGPPKPKFNSAPSRWGRWCGAIGLPFDPK